MGGSGLAAAEAPAGVANGLGGGARGAGFGGAGWDLGLAAALVGVVGVLRGRSPDPGVGMRREGHLR